MEILRPLMSNTSTLTTRTKFACILHYITLKEMVPPVPEMVQVSNMRLRIKLSRPGDLPSCEAVDFILRDYQFNIIKRLGLHSLHAWCTLTVILASGLVHLN